MAESLSVPDLTCVVLASPGRCSDAGAGGFPLKPTAKRNTTTRISAEGPILSPAEHAHSWSCSGGSLASLGPKFLLFLAVLPTRVPRPHGAGVGWESSTMLCFLRLAPSPSSKGLGWPRAEPSVCPAD